MLILPSSMNVNRKFIHYRCSKCNAINNANIDDFNRVEDIGFGEYAVFCIYCSHKEIKRIEGVR